MQRDYQLKQLTDAQEKKWDIIVIGGGATGLGIAVDASSRGYKTILLEQSDFSKGTSSRSTKLVHGGVRYLAQGDISLVLEALYERGLLRSNAPHLVKNQAFIIPSYDWWQGPFYTVGMKVYDMMAGKLGLGPSVKISRQKTLKAIPNLDENDLNGGVIYYDGQFDDSRLAINLAQTAVENNGVVINYMPVTGLLKNKNGLVCGVETLDIESNKKYRVRSKVVINATGVFVNGILSMDDPETPPLVRPSQGIHLVLDKSFLQGNSAIMIPKTSDGRVLFVVPWHDKVIVGTTDTPLQTKDIKLEPAALKEEIDFIMTTAAKYLKKAPSKKDVLSVFAGLRPLAAQQDQKSDSTSEISRSHRLMVSLSGLITITGGKWTTYRKMAEDVVNKAWMVGGVPEKKCVTKLMPIHGYVKNIDFETPDYFFGTDRDPINSMILADPNLSKKLHSDYWYTKGHVVWSVRHEMARTVEDFLARRIRILLLDARASMVMAPTVAEIMAKELKRGLPWIQSQVKEFQELAQKYILS